MQLTSVISRLSAEACHLSTLVLRLEETVPPAIATPAGKICDQTISTLQDFDLLVQSLDALSEFLTELTSLLPDQQTIDIGPALKAVHLAEVANRLAGRVACCKSQSVESVRPGPELF